MSVDFETGGPIFQVEIYHRTPGSSGVWGLVFNASDKQAALPKAIAAYVREGLSPVLIDRIEVCELSIPKDGDEIGD